MNAAGEMDQGHVLKCEADRSLELLSNDIWTTSVEQSLQQNISLPSIVAAS
jgi:hypothetical protein